MHRQRNQVMTSTTEPATDYRVAVFSPVHDPEHLSEIFQQILGAHPTDARIWARHLPGVLNETFSQSVAQKLAAAMAQAGLQVQVIKRDEVAILNRAERVHHVNFSENGLVLMNLYGQPAITIPWPAIEMICVGEAPLETTRHFSAERWDGIAGGRRSPHPPLETVLSPGLEAWITCRGTYPMLRIDHEHMNYECLGNRRVASSTVNFRSLIGDIVERATAAKLPESTLAYLKHERSLRYRFNTAADLLQYASLQALLARV